MINLKKDESQKCVEEDVKGAAVKAAGAGLQLVSYEKVFYHLNTDFIIHMTYLLINI